MTALLNCFRPTIMFIKGAHAGQFTKGGDPYWTHPVAVAEIVRDFQVSHFPLLGVDPDDEINAALLHDVVEDTPVTLDNLLEYGFTPATVEMVRLLTHIKEDHPDLTYLQYIEQVIIGSGNLGAMRVKLADNKHNGDPARIAQLPVELRTIKKRYDKSARMLGDALKAAGSK